MSPMPPRTRRRGTGAPPVRAARKLGEIRRAQLISTYGVGAMIAVENESFIVSGLDSWNISESRWIQERRLAASLGVSGFRLPPAPDPDLASDGVRAARFPIMYSCACGTLQPFRKFNSPAGRAECSTCQEDLVPSRFVVACSHGHLDDFPYWKWVHRGTERAAGGLCGGTLTFRADGSTASLRAVLIGCSCGARDVSMEGAFRRQALKNLGVRCSGRRPWLRNAPAESCDEPARTLQRGSSSVWFPVVHSALSIPPWSEGLPKIVARFYDKVKDEGPDVIRAYLRIEGILDQHPEYTPDDVIELVERLRHEETEFAGHPAQSTSAREAIYQQEYRTLQRDHPELEEADNQEFVCEPPSSGAPALKDKHGLEQIMLVKRLREVRALQTFTRVDEPGPTDDDRRRAALSSERIEWLPAIEVSGEGVFLRLDGARLDAWERLPGPVERARRIRESHVALLRRRAGITEQPAPGSPASPRFLLLHTLAHVLIDEWSLDGGYPAASLRERLYVSDEMAGILIYTATSDSAGSLGGIVAQGDPARLDETLRSALRRAEWCSNDPLCMESEASGTESLNLAACHACVLLPETSCEKNNTLLDRAALIGTPDGSTTGFFSP